jgi:hypothetical protein
VARESTLDEFVGGGESGGAAGDDVAGATETATETTDETATETTDETATETTDETAGPSVADATPATPTCAWRAGGVPCADCGASVEWLWTDGDGEGGRRVCAACKDW